jgi:diaminohydroxyphosphoribosylaminopyrimidine deaminase/5-amino-6-(5-phosphoribosylamino)uracil reductase
LSIDHERDPKAKESVQQGHGFRPRVTAGRDSGLERAGANREAAGLGVDAIYMRMALDLAAKSRGRTSPNPMVGAVIVKDGRVIGSGFHLGSGNPHAEIEALRDASLCGEDVRGSTLYVTLEPCCHWGRTPPCTDAIIQSGIERVVAAMSDPNPLVSGKGFAALRNANIPVTTGVLGDESLALNEVYVKFVTTKRPFLLLKCAMSLDGKIRTALGESRYITCEDSRRWVHLLRNEMDAVMVGVGTVLADDPLLTVRLVNAGATGVRNPVRIVVDSHLRIPVDSKMLKNSPGSGAFHEVIIATLEEEESPRALLLKNLGARIWTLPGKDHRVDLRALTERAAQAGITSILVEGGPTLAGAALQEGVVDKVLFFYAPVMIGGATVPGPIGGSGVERLNDAFRLERLKMGQCGSDLWVSGYLSGRSQRSVQ